MRKTLAPTLAFMLLAAFICGCQEAPPAKTAEEQRAELKAVAKGFLKDAVRESFKDPDSVEFQNLKVYPMGKDNWVLCGEVNGKNGFGAYNGYQQFVSFRVSPANTAVFVEGETDEVSVPEMTVKVCHD